MQHVPSSKSSSASKIADELTHFLADTYMLYLKTQNFHWNVKGPHFYSLHKMFEAQYQELAAAIDELAEQIRALGSYTPASFSQFNNLSSLKEATAATSAENMVQQLLKDHETMVEHASIIIAKAQKVQDESTADILIQRQKAHEKTAWMLKSSLK